MPNWRSTAKGVVSAAFLAAVVQAVAQGGSVLVVNDAALQETVETEPTRVPEPAALIALLGSGALLLVLARNRTIFSRN